jgi:PAS domain S-box-containing protein
MGEGIVVTDQEQRIVYANVALADILHTTSDNLVGKSLSEFVVDFDQAAYASVESNIQRGQNGAGNFTIRACNGLVRLVEYAGYPRFDEAGKYIGLFALVNDVTEQAKLESSLLQERQLFTEGLVVTFNWCIREDWRATISPSIAVRLSAGGIPDREDQLRDIITATTCRGSGRPTPIQWSSNSFAGCRIVTAAGDTAGSSLHEGATWRHRHPRTTWAAYHITRRKLAERASAAAVELQAITARSPTCTLPGRQRRFLDFSPPAGMRRPLHFLGKEHIHDAEARGEQAKRWCAGSSRPSCSQSSTR